MNKKYIIYTDGGARNNPGPAGAGFVIYESLTFPQGIQPREKTVGHQRKVRDKGRKKIIERGVYLGNATNNQAEYQAVLLALEEAQKIKAKEITVLMDSELAVRQLNREYKIKNKELGRLFVKIWNLLPTFDKIIFKHIPREKNKEADKLVNLAIDNGLLSLTKS